MQHLKRVFAIDIETCPDCGGTLRVIACIEDPPLICGLALMIYPYFVSSTLPLIGVGVVLSAIPYFVRL